LTRHQEVNVRWPVRRVAVAESSMEPTLRPGDWLLVWQGTAAPRGHREPVTIKPGQLVLARNPARPELLVVKRAAWREPGGWWLDSDNKRAGARDSAHFGLVPPELIEGRVLGRYWPPPRPGGRQPGRRRHGGRLRGH
jgi:signal peptidase I